MHGDARQEPQRADGTDLWSANIGEQARHFAWHPGVTTKSRRYGLPDDGLLAAPFVETPSISSMTEYTSRSADSSVPAMAPSPAVQQSFAADVAPSGPDPEFVASDAAAAPAVSTPRIVVPFEVPPPPAAIAEFLPGASTVVPPTSQMPLASFAARRPADNPSPVAYSARKPFRPAVDESTVTSLWLDAPPPPVRIDGPARPSDELSARRRGRHSEVKPTNPNLVAAAGYGVAAVTAVSAIVSVVVSKPAAVQGIWAGNSALGEAFGARQEPVAAAAPEATRPAAQPAAEANAEPAQPVEAVQEEPVSPDEAEVAAPLQHISLVSAAEETAQGNPVPWWNQPDAGLTPTDPVAPAPMSPVFVQAVQTSGATPWYAEQPVVAGAQTPVDSPQTEVADESPVTELPAPMPAMTEAPATTDATSPFDGTSPSVPAGVDPAVVDVTTAVMAPTGAPTTAPTTAPATASATTVPSTEPTTTIKPTATTTTAPTTAAPSTKPTTTTAPTTTAPTTTAPTTKPTTTTAPTTTAPTTTAPTTKPTTTTAPTTTAPTTKPTTTTAPTTTTPSTKPTTTAPSTKPTTTTAPTTTAPTTKPTTTAPTTTAPTTTAPTTTTPPTTPTAKPTITKPTVTKPTITKPTITKPTGTTTPGTTEPGTTEPDTKPTVTKPTVTKPTVTKPTVTKPSVTTPSTPAASSKPATTPSAAASTSAGTSPSVAAADPTP